MKHLTDPFKLRFPSRRRPAFTLLELLVVVAIIALLVSLVFVALGKVRLAAGRTKSLNSLRGMVRGYIAYASDNNQSLLPGYIEQDELRLLKQKVRGEDGNFLYDWQTTNCSANPPFTDSCDVSSYVFRLLPYIDRQWREVMTDYRSVEVISTIDIELQNGVYGAGTVNIASGGLGLGVVPSYGLNSVYLGGDSRHGGTYVTDRDPWRPSYSSEVVAATRLSEVINASGIIVFAPSKQANASYLPVNAAVNGIEWGYAELDPPYVHGTGSQQDPFGEANWALESVAGKAEVTAVVTNGDYSMGGGLPIVRAGGTQLPTAHLDGSVTIEDLSALGPSADQTPSAAVKAEIMSHWWPYSTGSAGQRGD